MPLAPARPSIKIKEDYSGELCTAKKDKVWLGRRVLALLKEAINDVLTNKGGDDRAILAPAGKYTVRPSYIQLPATPNSLLAVDQVLRWIMPTATATSDNPRNTQTKNSNNNDNIIEEIPSSFEILQHISHLNLCNESLP